MKPVLVGAALTAVALLEAAIPALAASAEPEVDATCVRTLHGTFDGPAAPGRGNASQADTLHMTGTLTCVDPAGKPLAAGTVDHTVSLPRTECTADEHGDTSATRVTWADGAVSTFGFEHTDVVKADGTASLVAAGGVTSDSARFAGDTLHGVGTGVSTGCGSSAAARKVASTMVLRLTHRPRPAVG
ncbi:hypothetical protein ACGF13_35860 [Kitasatospora sp. NPDC048286]|uniref:hypothetical protein n=1 Tax=unclassified Kitasatospora TaxID=2633591 RepID=UPI0037233305